MHIRHTVIASVVISLLAFCSSCASLVHTASVSKSDATLIPHASWDCGMPKGIPDPEKGTLVLEVAMTLEHVYDVGNTQYGNRQAIVIKDGTVTGDNIQGKVLFGGLDYQLTLANDVIEIEQILVLQAEDEKFIYVRNAGTGISEEDIRVVMDFEAPNGSSCEWLNTGTYIARRMLNLADMTLTLSVYDVSALDTAGTDNNVITVTKPAGIPFQPWEFRTASQTEEKGEQIVIETVTLGGSTSVGASKRGMRNIIPITGGTLSGVISGTVVPGGADYQNLSNPMTIDARYLWETDDGEIIVVRNAGPFGSLVPTFEANVDGNYAWLNSGSYLSSDPGMGAGGVSLSFYKSK